MIIVQTQIYFERIWDYWKKVIQQLGYPAMDKLVHKRLHCLVVDSKDITSSETYQQLTSSDNLYQEVAGVIISYIEKELLSAQEKKIIIFKFLNLTQNLPSVLLLSNETQNTFGEGALLNQSKTRQATIRCDTDCYMGTLSQESFNQTVAIVQQNIINKKIDIIMGC